MPRQDQIHQAVKNALLKAGWVVTDDPYRIHYEDVDVFADLRVEKSGEDVGSRRALVIEIKSFLDNSAVHSLEVALGQYIAYRTLLSKVAPELGLYLAVAETIYNIQFQRKSFQLIVRENQVAILVVDVIEEEIVEWID